MCSWKHCCSSNAQLSYAHDPSQYRCLRCRTSAQQKSAKSKITSIKHTVHTDMRDFIVLLCVDAL